MKRNIDDRQADSRLSQAVSTPSGQSWVRAPDEVAPVHRSADRRAQAAEITTPHVAMHSLAESIRQLQGIFVDLLLTLQQSPGTERQYLRSVRACARALDSLEALARRDRTSPAEDAPVPLSLSTLLERLAGSDLERAQWRQLFETRQYQAPLEALDGTLFQSRAGRSRRQGMGRLTARLAARALRLKEQGIPWSRLLEALICELQAAATLAAEDQVLLDRLRDMRAVTCPDNSGAYLRLTIARYKTDLVRRTRGATHADR